MAMFLFLQNVALLWDDFSTTDTSDGLSSGYYLLKEVLEYVGTIFQSEGSESTELVETTKSFALRIINSVYLSITFLFQYTCALIVYVFSNADTLQDAIDFVRYSKEPNFYDTLTSIVIYEKPIYFDCNPLHWAFKILKIFLFGSRVKSESEEFYIPAGKVILFLTLAALLCHSYYIRRNIRHEEIKEKVTELKESIPVTYEGNIKWEAGLVRNTAFPEEHLSLKIYVNSNICADPSHCLYYEDTIASSTASICKIVTDVISSPIVRSLENPNENNDIEEESKTEKKFKH